MSQIDEAKTKAAIASARLVVSGQVVGLGTGSTANYMIKELGRRIREEGLQLCGVPTSNSTGKLAAKYGIPLTTLSEHPKLDIAIDGADQVDPELNLIKGMGGALTREKIVDSSAEILVIIVDEGKMTHKLGTNQVVPVEVVPFAITPVVIRLEKIGGKSSLRLSGRGETYITDNGNNIIDVDFGPIRDAKKIEGEIKMISGVVESGLFIEMAKIVFIGTTIGRNIIVKKIERGVLKIE